MESSRRKEDKITKKDDLSHVAFIMDGNATWAKANGKSLMDGYRSGMQNMMTLILKANNLGLKYLTFYAFSSENWERPKKWVSDFMNLTLTFLKGNDFIRAVLEIDTRIRVIGDGTRLSNEVHDIISSYEEKTKSNTGITVCIALSYGGRDEIVRAARRIVASGSEINEDSMTKHLDTSGIPDPQLIIRTSGKQRLSNFLLWQAYYSELYFTDTLWPDFDEIELKFAIQKFGRSKRTYGK
ncbi:MAG: di-trans,poly-cis-decaprenylcistransferase [Holosporales bacterium]|jgi:undecaprenyl diphosphate synthase|nr:di-trans,poly-cis-decaprenylcistransferase [Holosporales bacterium]